MKDDDNDNLTECAITGRTAPTEPDDGDDDLAGAPVGWGVLTLQRRVLNPEWLEIQQGKEAMISLQAQQLNDEIPEEQRSQILALIALQIKAQFYTLEKDTPKFVTQEMTIPFGDPKLMPDLDKALRGAFAELGIKALPWDDDL